MKTTSLPFTLTPLSAIRIVLTITTIATHTAASQPLISPLNQYRALLDRQAGYMGSPMYPSLHGNLTIAFIGNGVPQGAEFYPTGSAALASPRSR